MRRHHATHCFEQSFTGTVLLAPGAFGCSSSSDSAPDSAAMGGAGSRPGGSTSPGANNRRVGNRNDQQRRCVHRLGLPLLARKTSGSSSASMTDRHGRLGAVSTEGPYLSGTFRCASPVFRGPAVVPAAGHVLEHAGCGWWGCWQYDQDPTWPVRRQLQSARRKRTWQARSPSRFRCSPITKNCRRRVLRRDGAGRGAGAMGISVALSCRLAVTLQKIGTQSPCCTSSRISGLRPSSRRDPTPFRQGHDREPDRWPAMKTVRGFRTNA